MEPETYMEREKRIERAEDKKCLKKQLYLALAVIGIVLLHKILINMF